MKESQTSLREIDFDYPLVKFSDDKRDWWRIRDAFEGVQIFGGIDLGETLSVENIRWVISDALNEEEHLTPKEYNNEV